MSHSRLGPVVLAGRRQPVGNSSVCGGAAALVGGRGSCPGPEKIDHAPGSGSSAQPEGPTHTARAVILEGPATWIFSWARRHGAGRRRACSGGGMALVLGRFLPVKSENSICGRRCRSKNGRAGGNRRVLHVRGSTSGRLALMAATETSAGGPSGGLGGIRLPKTSAERRGGVRGRSREPLAVKPIRVGARRSEKGGTALHVGDEGRR